MSTCWQCGKAVDPLFVTCPDCGVALDRPAPATRPDTTPAPALRPADAESWTCTSPDCESTVVPRGQACRYCGANEPGSTREARIGLRGPDFRIILQGAGPWVIGRTQEATPELASIGTVSGRHLRLERGPDGVLVLTDLDSTNGTYVDGELVTPATSVSIRTDSIIGLGRSLQLALEEEA